MDENINKFFLEEKTLEEMAIFFNKESFIQLDSFFKDSALIDLKKSLVNYNYIKEYKPMFWKKKYIDIKNLYSLDILKFVEFFRSSFFLNYIETFTGFNLIFKKISIENYTVGDYTLLNDRNKNKEGLDITFDLSDDFKQNWGGTSVYLIKTEDIFYLTPKYNSLTIIYNDENMMKYLKYINHKAKGKNIYRFSISMQIINELIELD